MLISKRATNILLVLLLAVGIGIVAMLASGVRGGPLDPPGPPSATGTLPQVEPRMPIPPVGWNGTFPIVINQKGSYFLTQNIQEVGGSANGIEIAVGLVTLDLNGFALTSFVSTGKGIFATGGFCAEIEIRNGSLLAWGGDGIDISNCTNSRITSVRVATSGGNGVTMGNTNSISDCIVSNNTGDGILGGTNDTVSRCSTNANQGDYGIRVSTGSEVSDSASDDNAAGVGIFLAVGNGSATVRDSEVKGNAYGIVADGFGLIAGNSAHDNVHDGIDVAAGSAMNNTVDNNGGYGIAVTGGAATGGEVTGNKADYNTLDGIYCDCLGTRIDSNHVVHNGAWGIHVLGSHNIVVRNSATLNTSGGYNVGVGNDEAPEQTAAAATSPMVNIKD